MAEKPLRLRLDKWLWAARFYKTRSVAADAIDGGKVKVNGQTAKPAKEVGVGDEISLVAGDQQWTVIVKDINALRRPAPEARLLYEETSNSREIRLKANELRKLAPTPGADLKGRPTKRDRRKISHFSDR